MINEELNLYKKCLCIYFMASVRVDFLLYFIARSILLERHRR